MGNCFTKPTPPLDTEATISHHLFPVTEANVPSNPGTSHGTIPPPQKVRKAVSAPPTGQPTKGSTNLLPLSPQRGRALSFVTSSSSGLNPNIRSTCAPTLGPPAARHPIRKLTSTMRQVLPERFKFRILVIGKRHSGKSSLIKAVFKVDVTAATERSLRQADINSEYSTEDNRYLVFHECSGLESQAEGPQNLRNIRDFILRRTDASNSVSERLHAVWICVPASDVIEGKLGEGVEEILGLKTVPVILVFTKFDAVVSKVLFDLGRRDAQQYELARARAQEMYIASCRRLFHKDPMAVPAEIVSDKPKYADLIENLVVTTDRFIVGPSAGFGGQGENPRVDALPLAWSTALRVKHDIVLQASIEVGRSGYWHDLQSSVDFADHTLKSCVNVIHDDLVEIWNLNDKARYLSSDRFKAKMSYLVKDLVGSDSLVSQPCPTTAGIQFAEWVSHVYKGSQENVRCIMGYIVDLTVILDVIFSTTAGDISPENVRLVIDRHVSSGKKDKIHHDIRRFVTEVYAIGFSVPQRDLILEKIIDLIQGYCLPAGGNRTLACGPTPHEFLR